MADLKNTNIDDTGFIKLPQGSSAQRPSGGDGLLRYNSDTDKLETYAGAASTWVAAGNDGALGTGGNAVFDVSDEGSTYRVHAFTSNGTFTCTRAGEVEYLIIAGGGAGSGNYYDDGGGGGAGGLIQGTTTVSATGYSISIGNGGNPSGGGGGNTTAFSLTALGGGGGGGHRGSGAAGGSGGGGTGYYGNGIPGRPYEGGAGNQPGSASGGLGNPGGGYAGNGYGSTVVYPQSSGGGGAGSIGDRPVNSSEPGKGGSGIQNSIAGAPYYWAGGGGGVREGKGGLGGGADASYGRGGSPARQAPDGSGGGGGGGRMSGDPGSPSSGGDGIVIVRYPLRPDDPSNFPQLDNVDPLIDFDFSKLSSFTGISGTGDVEDSRKNGVLGARVNSSPVYAPGSLLGTMTFNGSNQYIRVDEFHNRPTTQITVEGWVWPDKSVTTGTRRGAFWSNSASTYLGIFDSNDGGANHGLHWALQTSNSRTGGNNGSIPNQAWSYVVGTYDGSRTKGYVNGVEVYNVAQTGTVNDGTWYCGVYGNAVNDGTHNWAGEMSQLRMYSRALTATEISDNYEANRWRFGV